MRTVYFFRREKVSDDFSVNVDFIEYRKKNVDF